MTTVPGAAPSSTPLRAGICRIGMVMITRSRPRAAASGVVAVAPISAARAANVSGWRELAIATSWPSSLSRRASVPPIWPAPIMPICMTILPDESSAARRAGLHITRRGLEHGNETIAGLFLRSGILEPDGLGAHDVFHRDTVQTRDDLGVALATAGAQPGGDDITMGRDHDQQEIFVACLERVDGLARDVGDHHAPRRDIGVDADRQGIIETVRS